MKLSIENAKTQLFSDKEHYLQFLQAWKQAVNSPSVKSTKDPIYGNKLSGSVRSEHYMLYNILRGRSADVGFTPISNKNKLMNGVPLNLELHNARWAIERAANAAVDVQRKLTTASFLEFAQRTVDQMLAPFNGTVTTEMLEDIHRILPKIERVESNFGKGRKISADIISTGKAITYADLWNLLEATA